MESDFSNFVGRDEDLKTVKRYHRYSPMFYRSNLLIHSKRVLTMVESLIPVVKNYFPNFDEDASKIMALIHDDIEDGDVFRRNKL